MFCWMLQEHVEKAIALNPKDPTNYYLLGRWCYGVRTLDACCFQANYVFTARSELRQVLFLALFGAVTFFCVWTMKHLGNRWMDLRHVHREDVFGSSLGRVWRSRSISVACVRFMFGKTYLLSSFNLNLRLCLQLWYSSDNCKYRYQGDVSVMWNNTAMTLSTLLELLRDVLCRFFVFPFLPPPMRICFRRCLFVC